MSPCSTISFLSPCIALIGAAAFALASKQPGVQSFRIHLSDPSFSAKSASVSNKAPDLSNVPEEYHEFADVFSKVKANTLALHCPYDLKINLEEGASLPMTRLNSPPSRSSLTNIFRLVLSIPPIPLMELQSSLFGRRMDLSNFVSILGDSTKSLKKDWYPLLFISNLLTSTDKAHIYMALDLHHAYHLVHIAEGDK